MFCNQLAINFTLQLKFQMQSTPAQLKFHYEKVLYPYEVFLAKRDKIKVQQLMVTSYHWQLCLCLSTGCGREEKSYSISTNSDFIICQLLTENNKEKQIGGILLMCRFLAFNIDSDNYECGLF